MLNALDLFSGIAGNTLGLKEYTNTLAYCDCDEYAQAVLLSRMSEGIIKPAPICTDIKELDGSEFKGLIDIIVGGFPCQDISLAGNGKGLAGERSGLFFEVCRLVKEINPQFVFLENVPAVRSRGLREIVRAFTNLGYDCRWTCVSAAEVGATHIRKRWFLLAYTNVERLQGCKKIRNFKKGRSKTVEHSTGLSKNLFSCEQTLRKFIREDNGFPYRTYRIKCLGNAVVPRQAKAAFERLMGITNF